MIDTAKAPREDIASEAAVQNAVRAYTDWQKAREHTQKLEMRVHARVSRLTPAGFQAYADQTTRWDDDREH